MNAVKAGGREMNIFLMSLVATREPTSGSNEVEEKQQSRKASTAGRSAASPGRDAADGWERRKKNKTKHHAKVYIEAILCLVSTRIRRWWGWPREEEGEKKLSQIASIRFRLNGPWGGEVVSLTFSSLE